MNDYIINPWFFYYINMANDVLGVLWLGAVISVATAVVAGCVVTGSYEAKEPGWRRIWVPILKKAIVVAVLCVSGIILVPSREAIIQMTIASKVTYTNVKAVKKEAKHLVDYVITKSKELSK